MKKNVIFIVAALLTAVSCKLDYFPNDAVSSSSMASFRYMLKMCAKRHTPTNNGSGKHAIS